MYLNNLKYKILISLLAMASYAIAQDPGDIEDLLYIEVDNLNPVYKPVIGFGVGSLNFFGDVQTPNQSVFNGEIGFQLNVATYIDNKHYFRGNFYLIGGSLSGNERSSIDTTRNLNFKSSAYAFGVNINYDFDHILNPQGRLRPFISLGLEMITYDSKTDLSTTNTVGEEIPYYYWGDGSIRDDSQNLIKRDFIYETGVKEIDYGLEYPPYAIAIPIELGLDFHVTNRLMFRVGTSLHYTLSDEIDHVSHKNTQGVIGDPMNDMFTYSYFSLHLDLFSSDKTLTAERLFAEVDLDLTLIGDEDADGWMDAIDECPGTPFGVETDTAGCPVDSDLDRIPDYLDDEPNSRYGAYVDERGVEMSEDDVITSLDMSKAVNREDIAMYIRTPSSYSNYRKISSKEIPEHFKKIDKDADEYISFDEMMDAVDGFFDFDSDLSSDDIYELNNFFFSQ